MAIRFHLDEHIDSAIAAGLRRRGIEVSTTLEAGLAGASDLEQLQFARSRGRVIYTNDPDFLRMGSEGIEHAGLVFSHSGIRSIGQAIDYLVITSRVQERG